MSEGALFNFLILKHATIWRLLLWRNNSDFDSNSKKKKWNYSWLEYKYGVTVDHDTLLERLENASGLEGLPGHAYI